MILDRKNLVFSYDASLTNFVPKPLKKESLYEAIVRSRSKKEGEMEMKALTLSQISSYTSLLKSLENRFWLYGKTMPNKGLSYLLCFKSFDSLLFNNRKNKSTNLNSLTYSYNARKHYLKDRKKSVFFKSRLLALTKKGFKLNFYCLRLLLNLMMHLRPFVYKKKKPERKKEICKITYRFWLISNISLIGLLSSFRISNWSLQFSKLEKKKRLFARKWDLYYKGNQSLKSQISLRKN